MQEAKQYEKELFGEHLPGGEEREDALGYFYFKLHTLTGGISHIFYQEQKK